MKINDGKIDNNYSRKKVKFTIYGERMITKTVKACGINGRIYLPKEWIGKKS